MAKNVNRKERFKHLLSKAFLYGFWQEQPIFDADGYINPDLTVNKLISQILDCYDLSTREEYD